jgi:multidrug resistance efflux pump
MNDWMEGISDFYRDTFARMESRAESCEARFESLRLDEIDWKAERKRLRAELADAIKQRDEAQRDAERYRWLKSAGCYWVEIQSQPHGDYIFKGQAAHSLGGSIDNAIDAMLAAMRKEGGGA